ncbi:Gfo/Idh/MocA family protein [Paremcibacter congregatus]|uniref:Gfo/Idh/MocA family protein n=1 Tax=Paremcibacter congregatus TaxID=2043170 RepID=UPI003A915DED
MNKTVKIGLIGGGYIGKTHAIAYRSHPVVFTGRVTPELYMLAERDLATASERAQALGFARATGNWRDVMADPDIDIVAIATPNAQHKEMALAAIAAGKHVYCEKPLALNADEAREMATAAQKAGVVNMVGYNYLANPLIAQAKIMIDRGDLGEIIHFRGRHNEDYMADPAVPFGWRCDRTLSGTGTLGDMGSHIICMAMHLLGDITSVTADLQTVIPQRKMADGTLRAVENEDQAHCLARFHRGAIGILETSRVAQGRKLGLAFEIVGRTGSLVFDQERMNELKFYRSGNPEGEQGFKTLLVAPEHPDFVNFCPAAGHGLGYNDLKIIEVDKLLAAVEAGVLPPVDFEQACKIEQVIDACVRSAETGKWVAPADM